MAESLVQPAAEPTQLIENHEEALARIERTMQAGAITAADAFPAIFKRPIGEAEYGLALGEAVAHMNHLMHRDRAIRQPDAEGIWQFEAPVAASRRP